MRYDYEKLGASVGALITEKQKAYGDSFHKSGKVMEQLFPDGIPSESFVDALAIVRIVDKLFRIATDPSYGGESPWKDIAGYALLRLADKEAKSKDSVYTVVGEAKILEDLDNEIEESIPQLESVRKSIENFIPTITVGGKKYTPYDQDKDFHTWAADSKNQC